MEPSLWKDFEGLFDLFAISHDCKRGLQLGQLISTNNMFFQKCRFTGYLFGINQVLWTHNPQPQYSGYISRIHPLNKCSPAAPQVPPDVSTCSSAVSACQAASASPTARLLEVVAAMAPAVTRETSEKGRAEVNGNVWQCEPVPTGFLGIVKWCWVLYLCSWLEALGKREVKKESAQFASGPSPWGPWMIKITQTIPNHETTVPLRVLAMPLARNAMATQLITSHAKRQDWPGALEAPGRVVWNDKGNTGNTHKRII